jgi:hypothetical protein
VPSRLNRARAVFEVRLAIAAQFASRCVVARHATVNRRALAANEIELAHEAAALKLVVASELFFETSMGLYVIGERCDSGYRPRRRSQLVLSLNNILEIFKGDQDYVGWNSAAVIIERAERWLRGGEPFQTALSSVSQLVTYLRKMRNVIAHESDSAIEEYERATRALYGALPRRVVPGAQLLGAPPPGIPYLAGPRLFDAVLASYRLLAQRIVR